MKYKQKILLVLHGVDDELEAKLKRATKAFDEWIAKHTDDFAIEWTYWHNKYPIGLLTVTMAGNPRLQAYYDPVQISDIGGKAESELKTNFDVVGLIYNPEVFPDFQRYTVYPVHVPIMVYGFANFQKNVTRDGEDASMTEFLAHEVFHCEYFLAKYRGAPVRDRVHELSGLSDPRIYANFSVVLDELHPYFNLLAQAETLDQKQDEKSEKPKITEVIGSKLLKNVPQWLIVHHTLTARDKTTFEAVDRYHKALGWGRIGYHYFITADGHIHDGRGDGDVGAHTKEQSMNYKSLGICLAGNFDKEMPSQAQIDSLRDLLSELSKKYNIPPERIVPHRHFATYKSCYGRLLPDDWARSLLTNQEEKNDMLDVININGRFYAIGKDGLRHHIFNWATFAKGVQMGLWRGETDVKVSSEQDAPKEGDPILIIER